MGVFAEWQPKYAQRGIATFPLSLEEGRKKPTTRGYDRVGLKGSEQLAMKFPHIDAFAFAAGRRSGIMVVDIDAPNDEDLLRDTMRRYGDTSVIVQTGSGGFHCYYRFNNENRRVRPDPSVPVDYLGSGPVAASPSEGLRSRYNFIRGGLDVLDRLPVAANLIQFPSPKLARAALPLADLITEGRNGALYRHLMREARYCDDLGALMDVAFTFTKAIIDRTARHPFTDKEIRATAQQVFDTTARGDNRFGGKPHSILLNDTRDTLHQLGPDALFLHSVLRAWSGDKAQFPIANGMADHLPGGKWSLRRMQAARAALIEAGIVQEVEKATSAPRPAIYAWA